MSPAPLLAETREALADALPSTTRDLATPVVLVPTMGALHAGHVALFRAARERAGGEGSVVASIFVNPLQFGEGEDLERYPRTLEDDLALCENEGVDVVFAPGVDVVYPGGEPLVTVDPGPLAGILEGASRPAHFRGVLTVVAKLLGLVRPDVAVFGQKDYQQLVLVRRMCQDLCLGVEVVGVETVREPDGLALSSRNRYLDPDQRRAATVLSRALRAAQERASYGVTAARSAASSVIEDEPGIELDYLAILTPELDEVAVDRPETPTPGRILVAGRVGTTRLIDNMPLVLGGSVQAGRS
jgi:pantoate--beta-alanine ligase